MIMRVATPVETATASATTTTTTQNTTTRPKARRSREDCVTYYRSFTIVASQTNTAGTSNKDNDRAILPLQSIDSNYNVKRWLLSLRPAGKG